jgi:hypothetical protein
VKIIIGKDFRSPNCKKDVLTMDKWISMLSNGKPFLKLFQKKKSNTSGMFWASMVGMLIGAFLFGNKNRSEKRTSQATGLTNMLSKIPQMANMKGGASQVSKEPSHEKSQAEPRKSTNTSENLVNMFKKIPQLSKVAGMPELSKELGITSEASATSHKAGNKEGNLKDMLDKDPEIAEMAAEFTGSLTADSISNKNQ